MKTHTSLNSPQSLATQAPKSTQTLSGPTRPFWGLPLLREMSADYLGFVTRVHREYGDLTSMQVGSEQVIDVFDPGLVRELLVDNAAHLVRWERGIDVFEKMFGQSVLFTEGAVWQRQRRMLMPAFTPTRVTGYGALMADAATVTLDRVMPTGQDEAIVAMDGLFTRVAMDVIMLTLFGSRAPAEAAEAAEAVQVLSACAMKEMFWPMTLPDWLPLPGKAVKRRALRRLRGLVAQHIEVRRRSQPSGVSSGGDLLSMLLSLRDEEAGQSLSDVEVFGQCMGIFQAGHETSATALLWWSRLMAEHPASAARATAEVDAVLRGRPPGACDLSSMPWLVATLKEAMRLYPPIGALLTRRTTADLSLGGTPIPRGAMMRVTPWILQRDPRSFDDPDSFRPERFLPDAPPPPRGAWMPFGTGPRVCIGQHFAMLEMTIVAASLLQRYALSLPAEDLPWKPVLHVTLRPQGASLLRLTRRGL